MPDDTPTSAAWLIPEGRLRLSRAPAAELAAAATRAQEAAGLDAADFIVVAVPPGSGIDLRPLVEQAAQLHGR